MSSTKHSNFTVYKYGQSIRTDGSMIAWVEGFDNICQHPYNNFALANVTLNTATASLVACMDHNVTLHMDEWITSFSADHTLLATGSGNAETADPQLLVLDTSSGKVIIHISIALVSSYHACAMVLKGHHQ
jgi:pyruvate/2-oxoglutarate dehydrogenase complex dihydrolipoamide dehydrogenase (E3) component